MSKFFTRPLALLLAGVGAVLASEGMELSGLVSGLASPEAGSPGAPALPKALEAGRFAPLGKKSPFTLASTTEENADFAKDLILAGYVRMEGQDFVLVANRTRPDRLMVGTTPSPAAQGMILLQVEKDPSGDPTKLKAKIRKGAEVATLKYEAGAAPAGQAVPAQPAAGVPAPVAPTAPGAAAPNPAPGAPVIRRRVIPVPPAVPR